MLPGGRYRIKIKFAIIITTHLCGKMQKLDNGQASCVLHETENGGNNRAFEGMVAASVVAMLGIRCKLQEMHRTCKGGDDAVPTTIVKVIELDLERVKMKE